MPNETTFDEDRWMRLKPKAMAWIIGTVAIVVGSWVTVKFDMVTLRRDVTEHSVVLDHISTQLQAVENDAKAAREAAAKIERNALEAAAKIERSTAETAAKIERNVSEAALKSQFNQDLLNQKLDQIMAEKRGPRPGS